MLGLMEGQRVKAESSSAIGVEKILEAGVREHSNIDVMAARSDHSITTLVWNYHDDDVPKPPVAIHLELKGVPAKASAVLVRHYRIDNGHSNAFTVWKEMGSPQNPTPEQYVTLKAAGRLELMESPMWMKPNQGAVDLHFPLPAQGLSLVEVSW
jgi:xylan 1,4-beta-xylosidase